MPALRCNGIDIEFESLGAPAAPVILLIMGLGMQLIAWPDVFCRRLVDRGFRVIRFDNRDVGLSGKVKGGRRPNLVWAMLAARLHLPLHPPYTLGDMATDAVGLLDGLGVRQAHIVGASMGGMIAQILAARFPRRVLSLTSIMSSSGNSKVSRPRADALKALLSRPSDPRNQEMVIAHLARVFGVIGSPGFPADRAELHERIGRAVRRCYFPAGVARQMMAVIASGDRRALLKTIVAPTLVIHGAADVLVPPAAGQDTAHNIPGAKLLIVEGMGHDLPMSLCEKLASAIAAHCRAANADA